MKIDENQEKSDFNTKSLTSIPFGGPTTAATMHRMRIVTVFASSEVKYVPNGN